MAAQANDRQAFDQLIRRYQNKVFNICYRMLADYEEANDCAQETFVKIYRSLKAFQTGIELCHLALYDRRKHLQEPDAIGCIPAPEKNAEH